MGISTHIRLIVSSFLLIQLNMVRIVLFLGFLYIAAVLASPIFSEGDENVNLGQQEEGEDLQRDERFFFNKCVCRMPNFNRTVIAWGFQCLTFSSWCPTGSA